MFFSLSRNRTVSSARRKRRPSLESLEGRQLLSLGAELPGTVNTTTFLGQFTPDNATSSNGASVVVWVDQFSVSDLDIHAQRFNVSGAKVGPEITVASTIFNEVAPTVATDDRGDFVVAWNEVLPGGNSILEAQRFDSSGNRTGNTINLATGSIGGPDAAMDRAGNFVVSYTIAANNNADVKAQRYNAGGQFLGLVNVAASPSFDGNARVAMTPDGRFDIAYEHAFSGTDHDVFMNRYASNGSLLGTTTISVSASNDETPSVAVDSGGGGVVAWEQSGVIKAQRFTSGGALGSQASIINPFGTTAISPSVATKRDGSGAFVMSYTTLGRFVTYQVAEVSAANSVRVFDAGRGSGPLSIDANGNYVMTFAAMDQGDLNIHARRGNLLS